MSTASAPETLVAYKVLTAGEMAQLKADGTFAGSPVDLAYGFIHLSTGEQLDETVAKHFTGEDELHVATIDLEALGEAVRWEKSRGGALFPHVYGTLPLSAVIAYSPLEHGYDGRISLPVAG
jgi:uncharacterized protein (DUF952 family)